MRHKCDCGYRTFNRRRLKRHQRNCEVFNNERQSETRPSEGQKVEKELVETQASQKPVEDEGIEAGEMTRAELIELLEREGHTGVRRLNKPELVNLVGGD